MTPNLLLLACTTRRPIALVGGRLCLPLGRIHERTLGLTWGAAGTERLEWVDDLDHVVAGPYLPTISPLAGQLFDKPAMVAEAIGYLILNPMAHAHMGYRKQTGEEWRRNVCNLTVWGGKIAHTDQFTGFYCGGQEGAPIDQKRTFKLEGVQQIVLTGKLCWIPAKGIYEMAL